MGVRERKTRAREARELAGGGFEEEGDALKVATEEIEIGFLFEQSAFAGRSAGARCGVEGEGIISATFGWRETGERLGVSQGNGFLG